MKTHLRSISPSRARRSRTRWGATLVETALVLPVFLTMLFGVIELGRIFWVQNSLKLACQEAVRYGSVCGVTSDDVFGEVEARLGGTLDTENVSIIVKDASVYDTDGPYPHENLDADDFAALPDFGPEYPLEDLDPGTLILVRAEVSYQDITVLPVGLLSALLSVVSDQPSTAVFDDTMLNAYAFARHE